MDEVEAAAAVLAVSVDELSDEGMELESVSGAQEAAEARAPASEAIEAEEENKPDLPAGRDDGAGVRKVSAGPRILPSLPRAQHFACPTGPNHSRPFGRWQWLHCCRGPQICSQRATAGRGP